MIGRNYLIVFNHELGHVRSAQYFKRQATKIKFNCPPNFFHPIVESQYILPKKQSIATVQEEACITIAGMQANTLLARQIIEQALLHKQQLHPSMIRTCFVLVLEPFFYSFFTIIRDNISVKNTEDDVARYVHTMQYLYGKDTLTLNKFFINTFSNFINPILWTANPSIPMWSIGKIDRLGEVKIMPLIHLMLTPYNALEQHVICYLKARKQIMKLTVGAGQQSKSGIPYVTHTHEMLDTASRYQYSQQAINKPITFYTALETIKVSNIYQRLAIGFKLAVWRQPELIVDKKSPLEATIQWGGLGLIKLNYHITNTSQVFAEIGYKTQGFTLEYPIKEMLLFRLGFTQLIS